MFLKKRLYLAVLIVVLCFIAGYKSIFMFTLAQALLIIVLILCIYEIFRLYIGKKKPITCTRECSERFSNGDDNEIKLHISNLYPFAVSLEIIDEIPLQFQIRDLLFRLNIQARKDRLLTYQLRPVTRGVYSFGHVNIFASTRIGFISRRFKTAEPSDIKVYPSFLFQKQYDLIASSNHLALHGNKKVRQIGQQLEPDQIKDYIKDDDYRFINWKATARRGKLMVNVFRDERDQNIFCIIDKGRTMQAAFNKMTLLDYSINTALAFSHVAMMKGDKAGLITFGKKTDTIIPASRTNMQMQKIQEALYRQQTSFEESDFQSLNLTANRDIRHRSLMLIFTNFDSVLSMERQLLYLSTLAKRHTLLVIFFEDSDLYALAEKNPQTNEEVYQSVIAEKLIYEKTLIVRKLRQHNIMTLLTRPDQLTINVINRYLDIKAQGINS